MQITEEEFRRYLTIREKLSSNSIRTYLGRFRIIKRWLRENGEELSIKSVEMFLFLKKEEDELTNSTVNTYIQTFKHIDGYSKLYGLPHGYTEGLEGLPKTQPEIIILSVEELEALQKTHREFSNRNGVNCFDLDRRYLSLISFLIITGCRFNEAATLKVKRLDISNGCATLVNTKNKTNRFIFFEGPIKEELAYMIQGKSPDDLVFTNSRGKHFYASDFNDDLKIRAELAGIKKRVHAHLLRHSFATHLLIAGVDIAIVSTLLGHKDIQTTYETYVHLADNTLQKASMKHPLLIQYVQPTEIIKSIKENVEKFHLEQDSRFDYNINESTGKILIEVTVKPHL